MELLSTPRFTTQISKSTSKVPRAIHSLLNSHSSLLRKRLNHFHHHPSSQNVDESPNEKKSVASVKGMINVIRMVNLREWLPATSVDEVVSISYPLCMLIRRSTYAKYSGHASCMELDGLGEILCSYPWKCAECKTCEICNEKGDDVGSDQYRLSNILIWYF